MKNNMVLSDFSLKLVDYTIEKIYLYSNSRKRNGKKINFRCPFCGDSKKSASMKRGWYYTTTGTFHCFNCSINAGSYQLIAQLEGISVEQAKSNFIRSIATSGDRSTLNSAISSAFSVKESIANVGLDNQVVPVVDAVSLPDTAIPYECNEVAVTLINNRKILEAPFIPKGYKFYFDTEKNRIIIPWLVHGKPTYWQARKMFKHQEPKYLFPPNTIRPTFHVNFDDNYQYLFLLEGLFDSFFVKNSACIGSVNLTQRQMEDLKKYKDMGVKMVWFFDNHWVDKASRKAMLDICDKGGDDLFFVWDKDISDKDVNDYVISHGKNPFADIDYLIRHVQNSIMTKAILKLGEF